MRTFEPSVYSLVVYLLKINEICNSPGGWLIVAEGSRNSFSREPMVGEENLIFQRDLYCGVYTVYHLISPRVNEMTPRGE